MNSLSTVLIQEIDRFNKLLRVLRVGLTAFLVIAILDSYMYIRCIYVYLHAFLFV